MKKVLIIYRFLPQYRIEFYNGLRIALNESGIDLQLIYGKTNQTDSLRNDEVELDWATFVKNRYIRLGKIEILWQPVLKYLKGKDVVIVEGANRLLVNYILMFLRYVTNLKLGVWGHGRNLQLDLNDKRNRFKSKFLNKCDRYFAYTESVERYLLEYDFPEDKITVVQNAIDTNNLRKEYLEINPLEVDKLRTEFNLEGSLVGIFCGAMYPDKRIEFIIETCLFIKERVPNFQMIFIGAGVDSYIVSEAANNYSWIHYVGAKFGYCRIKYFKVSTIQIMPSAVGLGILDSFALETPLLTTTNPFHGPEIEYLESGVNGIITEDNLEVYSAEIVELLLSKKYFSLVEGCQRATLKYSIDNMVLNFKKGIEKML